MYVVVENVLGHTWLVECFYSSGTTVSSTIELTPSRTGRDVKLPKIRFILFPREIPVGASPPRPPS